MILIYKRVFICKRTTTDRSESLMQRSPLKTHAPLLYSGRGCFILVKYNCCAAEGAHASTCNLINTSRFPASRLNLPPLILPVFFFCFFLRYWLSSATEVVWIYLLLGGLTYPSQGSSTFCIRFKRLLLRLFFFYLGSHVHFAGRRFNRMMLFFWLLLVIMYF